MAIALAQASASNDVAPYEGCKVHIFLADNHRGDSDRMPLPCDPHNVNLPALPPPATHVEPEPEANGAEPDCLPGVVSAAEFLES